jgi:hypothetical protein
MARAKTTVRGRAPLARDSQQWMLDYLIQETGKVFHFQGEGRGRLPRSVRSHDMISKHLGLQARRLEALARAEAAAGHPETGLDFSFQATVMYAGAQHVIFENNDEKRYLYAGVRRCYDQVIALAPYRIEHIDIPWNGTLVSGNLHLWAELWVFADQHHMPSIGGGDSAANWAGPLHGAMCDWLRDRFADKPLRHPGQVVYVEANSAGPNSSTVALKRKWYEASETAGG